MERTVVGAGIVAVGGFLGAVTRYAVDVASGDVTGIGTLLVNVIGCFLLGVAVTRTLTVRVRLFVATGFISSFTTYSAFAADAITFGTIAGTGYVLVSYGAGFTAAVAGLTVGRRR